jgi:hypothetical protein
MYIQFHTDMYASQNQGFQASDVKPRQAAKPSKRASRKPSKKASYTNHLEKQESPLWLTPQSIQLLQTPVDPTLTTHPRKRLEEDLSGR